jgi:hypothetical protein
MFLLFTDKCLFVFVVKNLKLLFFTQYFNTHIFNKKSEIGVKLS